MISRLILIAVFACIAFSPPATAQQTMIITVIDVGQGDSILIEFPPRWWGSRKKMLIDGGPRFAAGLSGDVWAGTRQGHLVRIDDGRIETIDHVDDHIHSIAEAADGSLAPESVPV